MTDLDTRLYLSVNDLARDTPWLHPIATAYARYGVVLFAGLLAVGLLLSRHASPRATAAAFWAPAASLLALAANQPIGNAVHEARPYATHPGVLLLVTATRDFSFPSDHAVVAGAVATGLLLVDRRLGVAAALAAVAMAADRVYVGAHYPADVVAGLALGAAVAGLGWLAIRRLATHLAAVARRTRLRPLLVAGARSRRTWRAHVR